MKTIVDYKSKRRSAGIRSGSRWLPGGVALLAVVVLAGCMSMGAPVLPEPLRAPAAPVEDGSRLGDERLKKPGRRQIEPGPVVANTPIVTVDRRSLPKMRASKPVAFTLDAVNLTAFINEVFGVQLGLSLEIEQAVREKTDVISLRLAEPESPERVYVIAREVLQRYGVKVDESGEVLRFSVQTGPEVDTSPPQLLTGRDLPNMPAGQRSIYVAVPLDVSEPGRVAAQVRSLFSANPQLKLSEMPDSNAILVTGPTEVVQAALDAITLFDQVALRTKFSLRVNPLYLGADLLASELTKVLAGQGYTVRSGAGTGGVITMVPVPSANALILFSESQTALDAASRWVETLDQPAGDAVGDDGVYVYSARHTTVESLQPVLQALMGSPMAAAGAGGATAGQPAVSANGDHLVVDPVRNSIIFQGDARRWRALQGVMARLDQPARQVVIEVTVAEVTLTDEFSHGVEWALRNAGIGNFDGPLTALTGATGTGTGGLRWSPISSSGQVKAVLNAFAKNSRVNILSTPRIMVRSGETASINVGTEVPIITSQATAPDLQQGGNSSILQQVQFRKTGVSLEIEAVVHSGQRVDLKVTQEVSEAKATDTSDISSPSIFSRKLQTSLSLSDGDSYLLGGLISSSNTRARTEVPGLGRIPLLGKLFQNTLDENQRTELLLLITPYVVEDAGQAKEITEAVRQRFEQATR